MDHSDIEEHLVFLGLSPEDLEAAKAMLAKESDARPGVWYVRQEAPAEEN